MLCRPREVNSLDQGHTAEVTVHRLLPPPPRPARVEALWAPRLATLPAPWVPGLRSVMPQPPPPAPVSLLCSPWAVVTWHSWSSEAWPTPRAFRWCWFMSMSSWGESSLFRLGLPELRSWDHPTHLTATGLGPQKALTARHTVLLH